MNEDGLGNESFGDVSRNRRSRGGRWTDIGLSTCLVLAVSVPTMALEEDWNGRPMIDETNHLWIIAAFLVAAAFLVGGAMAGYRRPAAAATDSAAAAGIAVAVLLMGAVSRRLWMTHQDVPFAVARLWCLGVVASLLLSSAGAMLGRRLTTRPR
jgi:hypothetical protein